MLTKQDRQTDEPLAGATFVLKDAAGKTIRDRLITDKAGRIVVDGLAPGDYTFVEVKAPNRLSPRHDAAQGSCHDEPT